MQADPLPFIMLKESNEKDPHNTCEQYFDIRVSTKFCYLLGSSSSQNFDNSTELDVIQKADLENHNKEGGLWVVIHGKVFDLQEFKDQVC